MARGTSVEDLRARLTKKNDTHEIREPSVTESKTKIPDELVQIQAYIRWEKAGKPSYSPELQLVNFTISFCLISFYNIISFPFMFYIIDGIVSHCCYSFFGIIFPFIEGI